MINISKSFLIEQYYKKNKTMKEIAVILKCAHETIIRYFKRYNLKAKNKSEACKGRRKNTKYNQIITKNYLIKEYIVKKTNACQIAKEIGCTHKNILYYMKKFNIPRRNPSEAKIGIPKPKSFSKKISKIKKKFHKLHPNFCKGKNNSMFGVHRYGKDSPAYGKPASHGKGAYYNNVYMRSSYEIKFAFFLDCSGIKWEYESKRFYFEDCTYCPDFYLPEWNLYIEIKGYWRDNTKKRFDLFKKIYPKERIKVLMKPELEKLGVL